MTRRSFKMAIVGLVGSIVFCTLAYLLVSNVILASCIALEYMLKEPVNSLIILLNVFALGTMINMLYNKYKKK